MLHQLYMVAFMLVSMATKITTDFKDLTDFTKNQSEMVKKSIMKSKTKVTIAQLMILEGWSVVTFLGKGNGSHMVSKCNTQQ